MPDAYAPYLIEELRVHGVKNWEIDDKGRHNKLRFQWGDRTLMHVFPKTPSDRRGILNSLSDLRHTLGVRRVIRKSSAPERQRCPVEKPEKLLTITVKPSPFADLKTLLTPKEAVLCPRMSLAQIAAMLNSAPR